MSTDTPRMPSWSDTVARLKAAVQTSLHTAIHGGPLEDGSVRRRPAPEPEVRLRILAILCGWALALGTVGLLVGLWVLLRMYADPPGWFSPVMITMGLAGLGMTIAAFPTAGHRWLPWTLLGGATATLLFSLILLAAT